MARCAALAALLLLRGGLAQKLDLHLDVSIVRLQQRETAERAFVDVHGRERYFHGINAVVKGPPWVPRTDKFDVDTSLVDKDFEVLEALGVNVIRLGLMWPGVEPTEGAYNATYIAEIEKIIRNAGARGIYVLLDMHQDVLSEKYCGEGVPPFAAVDDDAKFTFPMPLGPKPGWYWNDELQYPRRDFCARHPWPSLYLAPAVGKAFENLYTKTPTREKWGDFWAYVATALKGTAGLLGFELINEPWNGDHVAHPTLLIPGQADDRRLQAAYNYVAPRIWDKDPDRLVFFAGVVTDDIAPAGFRTAPGGAANSERSVFTYHYYQPPQMMLEPYFKRRMKDARKLKTGIMLTEFFRDMKIYPTEAQGTAADEGAAEQQRRLWQHSYTNVVDVAEEHLQSYALWEFKSFCELSPDEEESQWDYFGACKTGYGGNIFNRDASVNPQAGRTYARTYAMAVSGETLSSFFDTTTAEYDLVYRINCDIEEPTVIYASLEYWYSIGPKVTVAPKDFATVSVTEPGNGAAYIDITRAEACVSGEKVAVRVTM